MPFAYSGFMTPIAVMVIMFTAYAALELTRTATIAANRTPWIVSGAAIMGYGIWVMHFTAMSGMTIPGAAPTFLILPTLISMVPAVVGVGTAFWCITRSGLTFVNLVASSLLMASGIVAMHYSGMVAYQIPGYVISNSFPHFIVAGVIAFLASMAALWMSFRATHSIYQAFAAILLGAGALGMHFTGSFGIDICSSPVPSEPPANLAIYVLENIEGRRAAVMASFAAVIACTAAIMASKNRRHVLEMEFSTSDALRQSQKMEALGQLTGGIAHDFNNLLQVISGSLDILDRDPTPERATKFRRAMRQATDRGTSLTRQLLAFSRRQNFVARPINLYDHLSKSKDLWVPTTAAGSIEMEVSLPTDLWTVNVDADALDVAMLNMIVNARDAMPNGGKIIVTAKNHHISVGSRLNFKTQKVGDYVEISVQDTGVGMSQTTKQRAFEPFFTTKDVGSGTGLGLAQVFGFVQHSEGALAVITGEGKGTTMRMFFPRSHLEVAKAATTVSPSAKQSSGSILVVEDDPNVASITTAFLEELGYDVWFAGTAVAATFALKERKPSMVLSDIILPGGMSGIDLAAHIQEHYSDLPVVLMTGFTPEMERVESLGIEVLKKPYLIDDLAKKLEDAKRK